MNNLEKFKAELAKDLSANTYSEEYILQRLDNLCLIAISQGKIEGANLEVIGEFLTEPESIKPEDMVKGEWYVCFLHDEHPFIDYLFKHNYANDELDIFPSDMYILTEKMYKKDDYIPFTLHSDNTIRKATREEVIKYFPNEFMPPEIDAHGGNDKGFICPASN